MICAVIAIPIMCLGIFQMRDMSEFSDNADKLLGEEALPGRSTRADQFIVNSDGRGKRGDQFGPNSDAGERSLSRSNPLMIGEYSSRQSLSPLPKESLPTASALPGFSLQVSSEDNVFCDALAGRHQDGVCLYMPSLYNIPTPLKAMVPRLFVKQESGTAFEVQLRQLPGHTFHAPDMEGECRERLDLIALSGEKMAYCEVNFARGNVAKGAQSFWRCSICRPDGKVFAQHNARGDVLPADSVHRIRLQAHGEPCPSSSFSFAVVHSTLKALVIDGNIGSRNFLATGVTEEKSFLAAALEPQESHDDGVMYSRLQIHPDADAGLVICCLLSIDRLTALRYRTSNP